ncbi:putative membrane protein [Corynebacterium glutamicum MB001]|nr:hypothetical protein [Corynebacterium glutamicum]AGT05608.1 putative membrane protein [Corynebacterium glutamicum MB001]ARV64223.1 hypothetical protein B7P23_04625 [Corynebacterium glutamicum]ASW14258.1 putative membrane protein [Corynebacterium glutamicum]AUI01151.1 hypothetical protein CYL77_08360 [Corynebacterium glutamicum]AUI04801.1 hypothetical protein C0I99_12060 [Corynebacterium glutamicum]
MKLFSRTPLVALGTAAAMAATSISVPAQAEEVAPAQVVYVADTVEEETGSSNGSSDIDSDTILDYVVVITGIVGVLSAGLTFATAFQRSLQ